MKTLFTLLISLSLCAKIQAQYCGYSGPDVCSPVINEPDSLGFQPDTLPVATRGLAYNSSSSFYLGSYTFEFSGQSVTLQFTGMRIYNVTGLPAGMCWATNRYNDSTNIAGDTMCINFTGTTCDTVGNYNIKIYANYTFSPDFPTEGFAEPFSLTLPVTDNNVQPCVQTVVNGIENYTANAKFEITSSNISISGIEEPGLITVTDLMGRLLYRSQYNPNAVTTINATNLSGLLLVNFNGAHGGVTKRIYK